MLHIIGQLIPHSRISKDAWFFIEKAIVEFRGDAWGSTITVPLPTRFAMYTTQSVDMGSAEVQRVTVTVKPQHGYGVTFVNYADEASVAAAQRWEEQQRS